LPETPMTYVGPQYSITLGDGKKDLVLSVVNGSSSGYQAYVARMVSEDACIIILSNVNDTEITRIGDDLGDFFTRYFLKIPIGKPIMLSRKLQTPAAIETRNLDSHLGFYSDKKATTFTGVVKEGNDYFTIGYQTTYGLQKAMELIPITRDSFFLSYDTLFRCQFSQDSADGKQIIEVKREGHLFWRGKKYEGIDLELSPYQGHYTSVELQKTYRFTMQSNLLIAEKFLGGTDTRLIPLQKDLFGFNRGFIEFKRDKEGILSGFTVFTKETDNSFGSGFIKIVL
jgi:hypothetical protein